jgi:hypothetical protein
VTIGHIGDLRDCDLALLRGSWQTVAPSPELTR